VEAGEAKSYLPKTLNIAFENIPDLLNYYIN